jgi:hypothetical protein
MGPESLVDMASADALSPAQRERMMEVLERYVDDVERGFAPDADQLVAEHPDLAGPLKAHLESLKLLNQAAAELRPGDDPPAGGVAAPTSRRSSWATTRSCARSAAAEWESSTRRGRTRSTGAWR